jgi:hypothetical protein
MNDIVTSIHGREIGLDARQRLVVRNGIVGMYESALTFGAIADGTTDNTAAVTRAIAAGVKVLYFPGDDQPYYFATTPGANSGIDPGGLVKIVGDGMGRSVLQYNEGTDVAPRKLFYRNDNNEGYDSTTLRDPLVFEDIEFRGTFSVSDTVDRGGQCIFLDSYKEIRFHRVKFKSISTFATDLHFNNRVVFDHCVWEDVARDGARSRDCFNVSVTNCTFARLGDDGVAYHTADYNAADSYNVDNGDPRRNGLFVANNFFLDTKVGVAALGARVVDIHNNQFLRGRETPIYITTATSAEGVHPQFGISVKDNLILDRADASSVSAIYIAAQAPVGAVATSSVIPGRPAVTTGTFVKPWDWIGSDAGDAADAFPPIADVMVTGNTIGRTLPTVSNYADWGYGYVGDTTVNYNPAITNAGLRWLVGINVAVGLRVIVSGNNVAHCTDGIIVAIPAINPTSFGTMIQNNVIFDVIGRCIQHAGSSQRRSDALISGNHINGDYYREAANSNTDGTYDSGNTTPTGIDLGGNGACVVTKNVIQNVARPYAVTALSDSEWTENTLICDPVALGSSASNKGIGNIPNPADGFRFIIADCDPTVATWGQLKNVCVESAAAQPSSGTYLRGQFVKNNAPTLAAGKVTIGWTRLTTGTAHVTNTDWAAAVVPNT